MKLHAKQEKDLIYFWISISLLNFLSIAAAHSHRKQVSFTVASSTVIHDRFIIGNLSFQRAEITIN